MSSYFHAVAIDYDGTLTDGPWPADDVLAAVRALRDAGRKCILVTGRILAELRADFPDVDRHFDAIVGENGAVISRDGEPPRPLVSPVEPSLGDALLRRNVPLRRGQVLLAMDAVHDAAVAEEIGRSGLECQVMHNRGALMVLPAGVSKGSGVAEALRELSLSPHSTAGIGDAENDHSLLSACEIGVAVANAIEPLRAHADVVLAEPDGRGVAAFLRGPLAEGVPGVEPRRWQARLGTYDDGAAATIPASRVNVGVYGGSGSGKSYLAGLLAEQLIGMQYTVCVLDLEGDHLGLGELPGVVAAGGREALPPPAQVAALLRHGLASVVVDLSQHGERTKRAYALELLTALRTARDESGIPHWIIVEEAQLPMRAELEGWWCHDAAQTGLCLVTHRPDRLCAGASARAEFVVDMDAEAGATLTRHGWPAPRRFTPGGRLTSHGRHWHKYAERGLPSERHFFFRDRRGLTGRTAGSVPEFQTEVRRASPDVVRHHAAHGDFSRWLRDVSQNRRLVHAVQETEAAIAAAADAADGVEPLRERLLQAIEAYTRPDWPAPDSAARQARTGG